LELDGQPVRSWLPNIEADDRDGPIDRGGFERRADARAFSLGVDHERAFHGHLAGTTAMDIDREREALDSRCSHSDLNPDQRAIAIRRLHKTREAARARERQAHGQTGPGKNASGQNGQERSTTRDELRDDLETELRVLMHRVA
jgi:hypothetical protein